MNGMYVQSAGRLVRPMADELNEVCLTQEDLDRLAAEFNLAETQALQLCVPETQPHGMLIPFPNAPAAYVLPERGRHARPPRLIPTWRLVALAVTSGGVLAGLIDLVVTR